MACAIMLVLKMPKKFQKEYRQSHFREKSTFVDAATRRSVYPAAPVLLTRSAALGALIMKRPPPDERGGPLKHSKFKNPLMSFRSQDLQSFALPDG